MGQSITLLSSTNDKLSIIGEPVRVDNWYGRSGGGLYTFAISVAKFVGFIYIDASLVSKPTDSDWFPISLNGKSNFLSYPTGNGNPLIGETSLTGFTVNGNYIWLRARMDRNGIIPVPMLPDQYGLFGIVESIQLKF